MGETHPSQAEKITILLKRQKRNFLPFSPSNLVPIMVFFGHRRPETPGSCKTVLLQKKKRRPEWSAVSNFMLKKSTS